MSLLPKNEPREIKTDEKLRFYFYGVPMSGKTTLASQFPNALMINTDGNFRQFTTPVVQLRDTVEQNGRIVERTYAWENFKEVLTELEAKNNTFETIILDLVEDAYEFCRLYVLKEVLKVNHESDSGFGKGWKMVDSEFLDCMRRFFALDYKNIIIISHEDKTSSVTKKNGEQISLIKANIRDAIANKLCGMVDVVARVTVDGDKRNLEFKCDSYVFGGGRVANTIIPLDYTELMNVCRK